MKPPDLNGVRVRIVKTRVISIEEFVKLGGDLSTRDIMIDGETWYVEHAVLNLQSNPEADIPYHLGKVQLVHLEPVI